MISKDRHIVGPQATKTCSHGKTNRYLKIGMTMKVQNLLWLTCNSCIRAMRWVR